MPVVLDAPPTQIRCSCLNQGLVVRLLARCYSTPVTRSPLISVVDDDESVRVSLGDLMGSVGYQVTTFSSAEEFLNSDSLRNIDCLILDVRMPGMDGFELQRRLLASKYEIPIIFITGHGNGRMRQRALSAGAVECLQKPFAEESLLRAIQSVLRE